MKQIYYLFAMLLALPFLGAAQNTVEVDASATYIGYANVFELPANGGDFVFGDFWGVPDLKTVVDAGAGTITLQPNYNTWGDGTDPFWVDQTTMTGNKTFEGNTFLEDPALAGSELTFNGATMSNTIDAGYDVVAFIKVFNSDFSVLKEETSPLVAGQNFSVVYTNVEAADAVVQYGFKVTGPNANPADEAALGSVVVTAPTLGIGDVDALKVSVYPNPSNQVWNISTADQNIKTVVIYDVLGKAVSTIEGNSNLVSINNETLSRGIYMAQISTDQGEKTVKLIKN
ncbi:MAG: T9SS type A sorting domain-containing protein [Flavobacteriaceae bacterium]|nr:T9SS type A sorting domain-containing protein [Flavobacteriaceae bacterium]